MSNFRIYNIWKKPNKIRDLLIRLVKKLKSAIIRVIIPRGMYAVEERYPCECKWFWKKYLANICRIRKYHSQDVIMLRLDLIGDCTMFTGAAKAIREYYKDRKMTIVCLSISRPVFEKLGIFDEIISLDFRPDNIDYDKLNKVIFEIQKKKYDILLQPQVSKLPVADILAAAVKCNTRIAIETKPGNSRAEWIKMVDFLYNKQIPYPRGVVSEFDYYGAFVRGLCNPEYKTTCPILNYDKQEFITGDYYVIYPGGSIRQKFWPAEKYARLADHIFEKTGLTGVLLGVANEQWVADNLKMALPERTRPHVIDLTGKTTINDVVDIIGNAKFVVSNDTSGVHIACATKTPSVVVVGGWHYDRFLPYHIEDVKSDDVLPLVAHTDMPCYHCDWSWDTVEKVNPDCLQQLKTEKLSICIEKIEYEQMQELVDQIIRKEKLC